MNYPKFLPVKDAVDLRKRISRFFNKKRDYVVHPLKKRDVAPIDLDNECEQLGFDVFHEKEITKAIETPSTSITEFLDLVSQTLPEGDLYLFGGILRDMALFGSRGFSSDIDLVVEGDWDLIVPRMEKFGAKKNKFGGLRFYHDDIPIDIWLARETWAVKQGYVEYKNIQSLLDTTVLNWDAILMNWRTKIFYHRPEYFEEINNRYIDIVLEFNPNPLGMVVRVLRHLVLKDAKKVSYALCNYLFKALKKYQFEEVKNAEILSYGNNFIHYKLYMAFKEQSLSVEIDGEGVLVEDVKKPMKQLVLPQELKDASIV